LANLASFEVSSTVIGPFEVALLLATTSLMVSASMVVVASLAVLAVTS